MVALVGYTGFVGSNLYATGQIDIGYNSKNIVSAYGTKPDLLIYAGLRAEKYLANHEPQKDMELIYQAEENIYEIAPKKLILISTIDVFKDSKHKDENAEIDIDGLHPYGYNRYRLEQWARAQYPDALIVRLPGLVGKNLKKNFIYDYIHVIPFMLKMEKMEELVQADPDLPQYYCRLNNGFYRLRDLQEEECALLKEKFHQIGFSAVNFTDSRSKYQFYDLHRLWNDLQIALAHGLTLWHPATEPVSAAEVYQYLTGCEFVNKLPGRPADYNYRTAYAGLFGGKDGYICDKRAVLDAIKKEVEK